MSKVTYVIPTTSYELRLDENDPFYLEMQNVTMSSNYTDRQALVKRLLKRMSPYFNAFMQQGKQRVFHAKEMRYYAITDFMTDAAQCAYTNSTLPDSLKV